MGLEDGSAQHTALVAVTRSVYTGLQILILYLSTGPVETDPSD